MRRLPGAVYVVGLVSLLTDLSSEMIVPLLPAFLASLGAGATWVGLLDGLGDTVASLVRLPAGVWADRASRRKPLIATGYGLSSLARPLMALVNLPLAAVGVRFLDRVGKGLRSAPRDALISDVAPKDQRGAAFGLHRAFDHTGALLGALTAFVLLSFAVTPRTVFAIAAIPGALAMLAIFLFLRETARARHGERRPLLDGGALSPPLRRVLLAIGLFGLGSASELFVVMRAQSVGLDLRWIPLLWASLHVPRMLLTGPLGALSDRLPRRHVIATGWLLHAAAAVGLAFAGSPAAVWALAVLLGAEAAFSEGAEKALVAELVRPEEQGRAFGWFNLCTGVVALPASLGFGLLWDHAGPAVAYFVSAGLAVVAVVVLLAGTARRAP